MRFELAQDCRAGARVDGEPSATARSRDNLKPARCRGVRLKRMVKHRHDTISDSEIVTLADRKLQEEVGS